MLEFTRDASWTPPIVTTVATTGDGVDGVWDAVAAHREYLTATGLLERRRRERVHNEVRELVAAHLLRLADARCQGPRFDAIVDRRQHGAVDPEVIAEELVADILGVPSDES
jgi:LAO/AO transport system kinase